MMAVARVYAYFNRDQFDAAQRAIAAEKLSGGAEGQFIETRIAWETGLRESALVQLRALHGRAPQDGEIYRTLVFYLREAGRRDEARRVALARQLAFPSSPDAYVDYISLCAEDGMAERQREAETQFLQEFEKTPAALLKLAGWATQKGDADLMWRIVTLCQAAPREACAATLLAIEAEITRGAYPVAAQKAREALTAKLPWNEPERLLLAGMEGVALFGRGLDAEGQAAVNRVLASASTPAPTLALLGRQLRGLGKTEPASRLLHRSVALDPLSQPALVELLRLELESKNLDNALPLVARLPGMRKPPAELMRALVATLESDRYLFVASRRDTIRTLQARLALTAGTAADGVDT